MYVSKRSTDNGLSERSYHLTTFVVDDHSNPPTVRNASDSTRVFSDGLFAVIAGGDFLFHLLFHRERTYDRERLSPDMFALACVRDAILRVDRFVGLFQCVQTCELQQSRHLVSFDT